MTSEALLEHLETGTTTVCRAWTVTRTDGVVLGFTDHDETLVIAGVEHKASTGMSARALMQGTGLAVDNSEAIGALSDSAISVEDLQAGRFDGASVSIWLVNWADPAERMELFRGGIGEVTHSGSEFRAELRGLTEALNRPTGRAYVRTCSAVLGDARCRFDLAQPGYSVDVPVTLIDDERARLTVPQAAVLEDRWFEHGRMDVISGPAAGLSAMIRADRLVAATREIELWQGIRGQLAVGDMVRLTAGCDKRAATCRTKFANLLNFRGFPFIPGEDWLTAYPRPGKSATGGSLGTRTSG